MSEQVDRIQILIDEKESMVSEYVKRKYPTEVLEEELDELYCDLALAKYDHSISDSEKEKRSLEQSGTFSEKIDQLLLDIMSGVK